MCVCMCGNVCTGYHVPLSKYGLALHAYWMTKHVYLCCVCANLLYCVFAYKCAKVKVADVYLFLSAMEDPECSSAGP